MHNGAFVPMEFVDIKPVKFKRLTDEQRALLCLKSSMNTIQYYESVQEIRQNPTQQSFEDDPFISSWNFNIDINMIKINSRILPPPNVNYTNGYRVSRDQHRLLGVWSNTRTQFYRPTQFPSVWALIDLSSSMTEESYKIFYAELSKVAADRGIYCHEPVLRYKYCPENYSITHIITELKDMMTKNRACRFFIVILPENVNIQDQIYGEIKKLVRFY